MSLEAGRVVQGKIRLARVLGKGGMGSVWIAEHLGLHTNVAVKFMAADIAENAEARGRFVREASAAAQIKSPHVVQVFDHGVTEDGYPFIVMELLEGEDLSKRIERLGALPSSDAVEIVTQICKALTRAHAQGIVHRDIKPENVFLVDTDDDELFVKVLDFGIAKRFSDSGMNMTSTGAMVGTPYYMSPEQIMSARDVDHRSDLWSVAVVTYHALTGALPFVAETIGALCVKINTATFEVPSHWRPELAALDEWFRKALAREPDERFASAKMLSEALRRAASVPVTHRGPAISAAPAESASLPSESWGSTEALANPSAPAAISIPTTLMEATISTSHPRSSKLPIVGALLGVLALVGVGVVSLVLLGGGSDNDQAEAAAEAPAPAPDPAPVPTPVASGVPAAPSSKDPVPPPPAPKPVIAPTEARPEVARAPKSSPPRAAAKPTAKTEQPPTPAKPEPNPKAPATSTATKKDYGF